MTRCTAHFLTLQVAALLLMLDAAELNSAPGARRVQHRLAPTPFGPAVDKGSHPRYFALSLFLVAATSQIMSPNGPGKNRGGG